MLDYQKPETIGGALSLLDKYGSKAVLIAGGTDVMVMIKKKAASPAALVSLQCIQGLNELSFKGNLRIGATVTHRTVERSSIIRGDFTALADAEDVLGSPQIRNVGTVVGNICNAAPSADTAPPLLVLGAHVKAMSLRNERIIPIDKLFAGPGKTILREDELVAELEIPKPLPRSASAYWKHQRRLALDLPILGVAVSLSLNTDKVSCPNSLDSTIPVESVFQSLEQDKLICKEVRIALGVAAPTPMRAWKAEGLLRGQAISGALMEEVARTASEEARPRDSVRGEAWYRKEMIRVFVKRMILKCVLRVVGQGKAAAGNQ